MQNSALCSAETASTFQRGGNFTRRRPMRVSAQRGPPCAPDRVASLERPGPKRRSTSPISPRRAYLDAIHASRGSSGRLGPCSTCRCSRTTSWSALSPFIARKSVRSPKSRSNWCRISPRRRSSPSRTRGCSTNCASAPTISPNRWSSRPRPRRCSGSSVSSPGELEPGVRVHAGECECASAMRDLASCIAARTANFAVGATPTRRLPPSLSATRRSRSSPHRRTSRSAASPRRRQVSTIADVTDGCPAYP